MFVFWRRLKEVLLRRRQDFTLQFAKGQGRRVGKAATRWSLLKATRPGLALAGRAVRVATSTGRTNRATSATFGLVKRTYQAAGRVSARPGLCRAITLPVFCARKVTRRRPPPKTGAGRVTGRRRAGRTGAPLSSTCTSAAA